MSLMWNPIEPVEQEHQVKQCVLCCVQFIQIPALPDVFAPVCERCEQVCDEMHLQFEDLLHVE